MTTIQPFDILLPAQSVDMTKWSVVSCDQFTSQPRYWSDLSAQVGGAPSTLKLIFPEVYLEDGNPDGRIANINATMNNYLTHGTFRTLKDSFVLVERTTKYGNSRLGVVLAVDLEDYKFVHPNNAVIRSTEDVVRDRIPPRLKIRKDAPIELPHIILLIDDRKKEVIEPLWAQKKESDKLYDFDLNMQGGHISGYRVDASKVIDVFNSYERDTVKGMYGEDTSFVFAVGDGNHSLATAQAHWENVKKTLTKEEAATHPARFALCEVENLHSDGIVFEPIHRFVFNADNDFVAYLQSNLSGEGSVKVFDSKTEQTVSVDANSAKAIADIQRVTDRYLSEHAECFIDYIHGLDNLRSVAVSNNGIAISMPVLGKEDLFGYVLKHGTLCRKSFSMGEAEEKRYYLEAKRIR